MIDVDFEWRGFKSRCISEGADPKIFAAAIRADMLEAGEAGDVVVTINGVPSVGWCESCDEPCMQGEWCGNDPDMEGYSVDDEGVYLCPRCRRYEEAFQEPTNDQ